RTKEGEHVSEASRRCSQRRRVRRMRAVPGRPTARPARVRHRERRVAMTRSRLAVAGFGLGLRRHRTAPRAAQGGGGRGGMGLACLSVVAAVGLFTAASALGGQTHPFQSEFNGSDTPAGSFSTADKLAVRQSNGDVYVLDKGHSVIAIFDGTGSFLSQVNPGGFGADPALAGDNSGPS